MNDQTPANPKFLYLDLDQWRQDIRTFANATRQALDAIADELSTQCSVGGSQITGVEGQPAGGRPQQSPRQRNEMSTRPVTQTSSSGDNDRLAKLKHQLAERLAKK